MEAELHARSTCNRMLSLTAAASAASAEVPSLREVELHPRTVVSDLFFFLECLSFLFYFNYKYFQVQFFFLNQNLYVFTFCLPHIQELRGEEGQVQHGSVVVASTDMSLLHDTRTMNTELSARVSGELILYPNVPAATDVAVSALPPSQCEDVPRHTAAVSLRYTSYLTFCLNSLC